MGEFLLLTARLGLRPHRAEDAPFMVALDSDPEVTRYTGETRGLDPERARAIVRALVAQFAERRMGRLVVVDLASGRRVGWCGLKWLDNEDVADLGYRFVRSAWGRGLATEAARECVRYGFEDLGLPRIIARVLAGNEASMRVLVKAGFSLVGTDAGGELLFEVTAPRRRHPRPPRTHAGAPGRPGRSWAPCEGAASPRFRAIRPPDP